MFIMSINWPYFACSHRRCWRSIMWANNKTGKLQEKWVENVSIMAVSHRFSCHITIFGCAADAATLRYWIRLRYRIRFITRDAQLTLNAWDSNLGIDEFFCPNHLFKTQSKAMYNFAHLLTTSISKFFVKLYQVLGELIPSCWAAEHYRKMVEEIQQKWVWKRRTKAFQSLAWINPWGCKIPIEKSHKDEARFIGGTWLHKCRGSEYRYRYLPTCISNESHFPFRHPNNNAPRDTPRFAITKLRSLSWVKPSLSQRELMPLRAWVWLNSAFSNTATKFFFGNVTWYVW